MPITPAHVQAGASALSAISGLFGGNGGPGPGELNKLNRDNQVALWEMQLPAMVVGAKKAGLHPLVAAGVNPAQAASAGSVVGDTSFADRLSDAGQNISRAASAMSTKTERASAEVRDALLLEKMRLENDLLRSQISTINRPTTPPTGGDSLGSNQGAEYGPVGLNTPTGMYGAKEGGATTDYTYSRTGTGGLAIVPSSDVKTRIEDALIPELQWSIRNTHLFGKPTPPDSRQFPLPPTHKWRWSWTTQEWKPIRKDKEPSMENLQRMIKERR